MNDSPAQAHLIAVTALGSGHRHGQHRLPEQKISIP